jgi:uncharacterized protein (TIGR00369 family)
MKLEQRPFPLSIPFVEELGFELWGFDDGQAELRMDLSDKHLNSWRVAHGGVVMTLLDVAMAHAARSTKPAETHGVPGIATIEMKTSFVRAAEGRLRAQAKLLHRTTTLAFCEARLVDEHDQLCAHATGTFKYLRALPSTGRHLKPLQRAEPQQPDSETPTPDTPP